MLYYHALKCTAVFPKEVDARILYISISLSAMQYYQKKLMPALSEIMQKVLNPTQMQVSRVFKLGSTKFDFYGCTFLVN